MSTNQKKELSTTSPNKTAATVPSAARRAELLRLYKERKRRSRALRAKVTPKIPLVEPSAMRPARSSVEPSRRG